MADCARSVHRPFSLSPTGVEGWGEGEARAKLRNTPRTPHVHAPLESESPASPPTRPLTLTLSPDGGEGTRVQTLRAFSQPFRVWPQRVDEWHRLATHTLNTARPVPPVTRHLSLS